MENAELQDLVYFLRNKLSRTESDTRDQEPHALWDANLGVSGGFSADLRLLVMKLRRRMLPYLKYVA